MIQYTGSDICFKFQQPNGTAEMGGMLFENFTFNASHATGGMFQFNDPALTPVPTSDNTTPDFIRNVNFKGCAFWGPGTATAGDAIKGVKVFELVTDENCYFRGWRRGVWLYGCDNNTIAGRLVLNGRNVQIEAAGTFGNDNYVPTRWLGATYNAGEDQYCIYDAGNHTTMVGTDIEPLAGAAAAMYLNGTDRKYLSIDWTFSNFTPCFRLGPDARECIFYGVANANVLSAPVIDAATHVDNAYVISDFPGSFSIVLLRV